MNELSRRAALKSVGGASTGGADWPPGWQTLQHGIAVGRYTDPAFLKLEFEKLWSRVWQVAARVDEVPEPGDFTTYDIGQRSVIVVRADKDTIKAYHNVCPHRGTALGVGSGTYERSQIMCPFHGWRWNLAGEIQYVLERQEFRGGQLKDSDCALKEVAVRIYAGFVFINFDKNPESFDDFIAPIRQLLDDLAIGDMHHIWWKSIAVPANWKVAQEAFFEGYHVPATHPQLEPAGCEVVTGIRSAEGFHFSHHNVFYENFAHGHGRFFGGKKTPMAGHVADPTADPVEAMAGRLQLLVDGMDAMILQQDVDLIRSLKGKPIPAGSSLGGEYVKALYSNAAAERRPMPKPVPEIIGQWGGEVVLFPNFMILPQAGNAMMYRVRPHATDPNQCTFEIYSTRTLPAAVKPPRATVQPVTDTSDPAQVLLIPRQDLGNIPRMQKGLQTGGIRNIYLAAEQEKIILNHHQELDRYLQS